MAPGSTRCVFPGPRARGDAVTMVQGAYAPLDRFVCEHEGAGALDEVDDGALAGLLDPSTEVALRRWRWPRPSSELTAAHGRAT